MKRIAVVILLIASALRVSAQDILIKNDEERVRRNVRIVLGTEASLYAASMTGLYFLWYADYKQSSFHFKDDSGEWLQMDKVGHATTAYHVGLIGYEALRVAGLDEKRAILYGAPLGFVFQTTVEIFDGFSDGWGFSWTDVAANTVGMGLFMGQQFLWHEQRIALKYSFHTTKYAKHRPDLLGSNVLEQTLKDYNGQTYWLSCNIKSLALPDDCRFPAWLNIAFGYSADGMTGAYENVLEHNGKPIPAYRRTRQFLISPDIDLTRIPVKNKFWKTTLKVLSFIKIPLPTFQFDDNGCCDWYWLYF